MDDLYHSCPRQAGFQTKQYTLYLNWVLTPSVINMVGHNKCVFYLLHIFIHSLHNLRYVHVGETFCQQINTFQWLTIHVHVFIVTVGCLYYETYICKGDKWAGGGGARSHLYPLPMYVS